MDFQKVADAIEKSSSEIKDLLFSNEIGQVLQSIAKNNNLDDETSLKMIEEIGYIILGLKERSSIKNSLANIGVQKTAVFSIIQEVSKKIFTELDKINNNQENKEVVPETVMEDPIVITQETKEDVVKELPRKIEEPEKVSIPQSVSNIPVIPPANLPMVEEGEVAHVVPARTTEVVQSGGPHVEMPKPVEPVKPPVPTITTVTNQIKTDKPPVPPPDYRYEGKDPYREPLV